VHLDSITSSAIEGQFLAFTGGGGGCIILPEPSSATSGHFDLCCKCHLPYVCLSTLVDDRWWCDFIGKAKGFVDRKGGHEEGSCPPKPSLTSSLYLLKRSLHSVATHVVKVKRVRFETIMVPLARGYSLVSEGGSCW
jgi:hypothetical protein